MLAIPVVEVVVVVGPVVGAVAVVTALAGPLVVYPTELRFADDVVVAEAVAVAAALWASIFLLSALRRVFVPSTTADHDMYG